MKRPNATTVFILLLLIGNATLYLRSSDATERIVDRSLAESVWGGCPGFYVGENQPGYCSSNEVIFGKPNLKALLQLSCTKTEQCPFSYFWDFSLPGGEVFEFTEQFCTTPCGGGCGEFTVSYFQCDDGIPY